MTPLVNPPWVDAWHESAIHGVDTPSVSSPDTSELFEPDVSPVAEPELGHEHVVSQDVNCIPHGCSLSQAGTCIGYGTGETRSASAAGYRCLTPSSHVMLPTVTACGLYSILPQAMLAQLIITHTQEYSRTRVKAARAPHPMVY